MKYKGKDFQMCDGWYLNVNDRIHAFNLKIPGSTENMSVAHAYTDDLLHFHLCEDILPPLKDDTMPEDYLDKWTGCAYTAPDGVYYIYYTMRNKNESQKIGLALSENLINFKLYPDNPVLVPDKEVFAYTGNADIKEDCRDMIVVFDEKTGKYYGYFAAMAETEAGYKGVIGVAESDDLVSWTNQSIAYTPKFDGIIEVPDVYFLDGKWYLTVLTHSSFGAKGNFSDENVVSGTIYAVSDTPKGPFTEGDDNVFIGGTYQSGYTCRTFMYKGRRYLLYIDKSEDGWAVSLPKEVRVVNGNLRPCYTPILKDLRNRVLVENLTEKNLKEISSVIAWNISNGNAAVTDDGLNISANDYSYQWYMIESDCCDAAEVACQIHLDGKAGGVIIESGGKEYFVELNHSSQTLSVYDGRLDFDVICRRKFSFEKPKDFSMRMIVLEGQIEIYIDDILVLQNAFETKDMKFGLAVGSGRCLYKDFKIYTLENETGCTS